MPRKKSGTKKAAASRKKTRRKTVASRTKVRTAKGARKARSPARKKVRVKRKTARLHPSLAETAVAKVRDAGHLVTEAAHSVERVVVGAASRLAGTPHKRR